MNNLYCIANIAIRTQSVNANSFKYNCGYYQLLIDDVNIKQLLLDLKKRPEFCLCERTDHWDTTTYLCLFFKPSLQFVATTGFLSRHRIINQFFTIPTNDNILALPNPEATKHSQDTQISESTLDHFYTKLREYHDMNDSDIGDSIPHDFYSEKLRPTLRNYQNRAVRWMIYRERKLKYFPTECHPLPLKYEHFNESSFFYNPRTMEIIPNKGPGPIKIPSGGILADEMGLGKTVEMLALILHNPRRQKRKRIASILEDVDLSHSKPAAFHKHIHRIKCICQQSSSKNVIQCVQCHLFQHVKCVRRNSLADNNDPYYCPECWRNKPMIVSSSTFIVSPQSIKLQWEDEVATHIVGGANFKVLIYNGIKESGWISPADLAKYDIVITDYNTLKQELHFANVKNESRCSRYERRSIIPICPLKHVHWWRVCLDEAQMVEATIANASQMVKQLLAEHRWSITGTPIEKSIDNLYGLLYWIGCEPYSDINEWRKLSLPFQLGDTEPLVNIMGKIMWRTCKSSVSSEIDIPPQTEILHQVTMSDLQSFFYASEHNQCAAMFHEKAKKIGSSSSSSLSMFKMNAHTLNLIMYPLRKLRQDCTIPTLFSKHDQSVVKKVLPPDELLKHLMSKTENDCKSELRSIASSLNGLAALFIIKEDYNPAIEKYKQVLKWAGDYTGPISVDSLLQVHALHNLLEILPLMENTTELEKDRAAFEDNLKRLEWKYMENSSLLIKKAKEQQKIAEDAVRTLETKMLDKTYSWWRDLLFNLKSTETERTLLEKINLERAANYTQSVLENFNSVHGVALVLVNWLDVIRKGRNELRKMFHTLEFFSNNIKQKDELQPDQVRKIEEFVEIATLCHLQFEKKKEEKEERTKPKKFCLLCKVKHHLNKYECTIFKKSIDEDDDEFNSIGSWNPTFQETILKNLHSHFKREQSIDQDILKDGETHLSEIEAIKNEFKEYSTLWVEINYAAAAYDELNMCKSRLKAVDDEEMEDQPASKLLVHNFDVEYTMEENKYQLQEAQTKFVRLQGTLKYLKYLERCSEPEPCPICKQMPEKRYCVLECGHHMCLICTIHMAKFYKSQLQCCICRHKQKMDDINYVTCKSNTTNDESATNSAVEVKGYYSNKIEEIVRVILLLKQECNETKILIFSHWDTILMTIGNALSENSIQFRKKSQKFHQSISDFKKKELGITCLLLPLQYGSKGLNLIEATHVFLVEPILNPAEELQAIGRVHRIGQTKPTFVHRFIVLNTIEETIYNTISNDSTGKWQTKDVTVKNLEELFILKDQHALDDVVYK